MRIPLILTGAAALLLGLAACTPKHSSFAFEQCNYADSTDYADLTVNVELPVAGSAASRAVRAALLDLMDQSLSHADTYEEERAFPLFSGDTDDTAALMEYYEERTLRHLGSLSQADADERKQSIRENDDLSAAEKAELLEYLPRWSFDYELKKVRETDRYLVFSLQDISYMGGAHGSVGGAGFPTFDRQDGHQVVPVLRPDCTEDIQPLLLRGLREYFREAGVELESGELMEMLTLPEEGLVPLPTWEPYPAEDGLVFLYQQYEIAPYASGMPSFVLPFDEVKEFLSADALRVFGL